ncbi:class I SAM-dependent methyltransferase [Microbulbifer epialgicus]|uniref:Class I SAM-dependent methyltransferase n=1 Tax=Microbulbifer epialgicus TaxID=393907 RepID=A0ABV4P662_9GAMM
MRQKRKFSSANFTDGESSGIPTLFSVSEQGQKLLDEVKRSGSRARFVIDFDGNNLHAHLEATPKIQQLAVDLKLQFRSELITDGYNIRVVDFSRIHGVEAADLDKLAEALELKNGASVLDLMCGYGEVSAHVLGYAKRSDISIDLSMCDLHKTQLDRIPQNIKSQVSNVTIGDARDLPYPDAQFDAIAIKMGIHEVPQIDQPLIFQQVFRVLKPGGRFVIWGVMSNSGPEQDAFTEQIQKKNELPGYESLIVDRYFTRGEQMLWLFKEAGFINIEDIFQAHFHESTLARLDSELGGDRHKLEELNAFVRRCTPDSIRKEVDFKDEGDSISMKIPNRIFRGFKPE